MAVVRCVCHQKSFAELRALARTHGWCTAAEVSLETSCGLGCGSCRPYLEAMMETGATSFAVAQPGEKPKPTKPDPWDVGS